MLVLLYFAKYFLSWEEELFNFPENREKIVKDMGISHTLHLKNGFEIAIDEDGDENDILGNHDLTLSVGTGFTVKGKPSVNIEIPLLFSELVKIHNQLGSLIKDFPNCMDWSSK